MTEKARYVTGKFWVVTLLSFFVFPAFSQLNIKIDHRVGEQVLKLDSGSYANELKQEFKVSNFKYYIGQISFVKSDGTQIAYPDYFLVDEYEAESKNISLKSLPEGEYTSVVFTMGVDSLSNCSGAQSGALDPVNAMFWAWNTGYIFLKLEGTSPHSTAPGKVYEFHIGGYRQPSNNIKRIELQFPEKLRVKSNEHVELKLSVDVLEILKKPLTIDFSVYNSITGTENSNLISSNYEDVFRLISVLHVP